MQESEDPGPLLVARESDQPDERRPLGEWITQDGSVFERSELEFSWSREQGWKFSPVPWVWRAIGQLDAQQLSRLAEAVETSGFEACAPEYRPSHKVWDAGATTWRVHLRGRDYGTRLIAVEPGSVPPVRAVWEAFEAALAAAVDPEPPAA